MFDIAFLIRLIPGGIAGLSYVSYIRSIQANKTRLSISTRLILVLINGVILWSLFKANAWHWQGIALFAGSICVSVFALFSKDGFWKWTKYDTWCTVASGIIIAILLATYIPEVSQFLGTLGVNHKIVPLFLSLLVQLIAWLATIDKLLQHPDTQDPVAFTLVVLSALVQLMIQHEHTVITVAQPIVSGVIAGTIVFIVAKRAPQVLRESFALYCPLFRRG